MNFAEALEALKDGKKKIRVNNDLKKTYWVDGGSIRSSEGRCIEVYTEDGWVSASFFDKDILSDKWEVVE